MRDSAEILRGRNPTSPLPRSVTATQKQFPSLTDLELWSDNEWRAALPDSFLGEPAPRLQSLGLEFIQFQKIWTLLSSAICQWASSILTFIWNIPDSGYISPETIAYVPILSNPARNSLARVPLQRFLSITPRPRGSESVSVFVHRPPQSHPMCVSRHQRAQSEEPLAHVDAARHLYFILSRYHCSMNLPLTSQNFRSSSINCRVEKLMSPDKADLYFSPSRSHFPRK